LANNLFFNKIILGFKKVGQHSNGQTISLQGRLDQRRLDWTMTH